MYSERNGVEVIRTLKIIRLMVDNDIITCGIALNACKLLKNSYKTRIPIKDIEELMKELSKKVIDFSTT